MPYSYKRVVVRVKSEHIGRISERLFRLPLGSRPFWSLGKGKLCRETSVCLLFHLYTRPIAFWPMLQRRRPISLGHFFATNSILDDQVDVLQTIPHCHSSMVEIMFHRTTMRKALVSFNVHKSSGPGGIFPIVIKICSPELASVLTTFISTLVFT